MQVTIEQASLSDSAAIGSLVRQELGYPEIGDNGLVSRMRQMEADAHYTTLVAKVHGDIIGFIGLHRGISFEADGGYIRIIALAVKGEYQRSGVGSLLLQAAEDHAARQNIHLIALNSGLSRHGAHAFYESKGYIKKGYSFKKSI